MDTGLRPRGSRARECYQKQYGGTRSVADKQSKKMRIRHSSTLYIREEHPLSSVCLSRKKLNKLHITLFSRKPRKTI